MSRQLEYYYAHRAEVLKKAKARYARRSPGERRYLIAYAMKWQNANWYRFREIRQPRQRAAESDWRQKIEPRYAREILEKCGVRPTKRKIKNKIEELKIWRLRKTLKAIALSALLQNPPPTNLSPR